MNQSIGFIGAGNMATAIISGLIKKFPSLRERLFVTDKSEHKAEELHNLFMVNQCRDNVELVQKSDIVVLAVKPLHFQEVLKEIQSHVTQEKVLVSIAAGISIGRIEDSFGEGVKVVRTMPNTPSFVNEGMTAITPNAYVKDEELESVIEIFRSIGKADVVDEGHIDAIVGISGSSPAYVYMFIEALADGAVLEGLPRDKAYTYAAQAVLGSAKMVLESGRHPGELKDMVCSPGGTTIEAVSSLEKNNFRGAVIEAVHVCAQKSKKLGGK